MYRSQILMRIIIAAVAGVLLAPGLSSADQFRILRQSESEMEQAFLQVLSGKKVRRQGKDESFPEQKEEMGRKFSSYIKPGAVKEVFIPFEGRMVEDMQVYRIFGEAVIVDYEKLKPLALKPCDLIRVTDKKDNSYDLCVFSDAADLRGTLTFPNYQRFWFAIPGQLKE